MNPQIRTCFVAVQGTSRNANSENRETHGDCFSDDPYPKVGYFPHHSGQFNSPETETNSHMLTENYPHNIKDCPDATRLPIILSKWQPLRANNIAELRLILGKNV